jgi:opacity protein-like surface antigen
MRKIISLASLSLFVVNSASAASSTPWYASVEAGMGFASKFDKLNYDKKRPDDSVVYGAGLGKMLDNTFSVDASLYRFHEFSYATNLASANNARTTQDISSTLLTLNVNADLGKFSAFTPYVTAGVGAARNEADDYVQGNTRAFGKTRTDFAWNVGAGVEVETGTPVNLSLSYRYFDLGQAKTSGRAFNGTSNVSATPVKTDLTSHTILAGLVFKF